NNETGLHPWPRCGGRTTGCGQSRGCSGRIGAPRGDRLFGRDSAAMVGSDWPTAPGSLLAPAHGAVWSATGEIGLQRGHGGRALDCPAREATAEKSGVTNEAPELLEVAASGVRWRILPGCQDLLLGPTGLRLDEWLRDGCAQVVKHGPHRTVYRVALPGLSFHLKHYRLPDMRAWLRQLVRPAKARTEFVRALAVAARRVPTVVPLALGERWLGPRPSDSYLITRSLENAEPLSHFIETTLPGFAPARCTRIRQLLAHALGEFVAQLHNTGISHRDLHAANMLVRLEENGRPCLYLIDLHAVHLGQPLNWARSRENLVILNRWFVLRASRADRFRFWRTYCRKRAAVPAPWPSLGNSSTLAAGPRSPVKNL